MTPQVDRLRRSGLSRSEFIRSHGLSANRIDYWRKRLRDSEAKPVTRFHAVRVVEGPVARPVVGEVEILLSGGRRIAVRPGFDAGLLTELIRLLEGLPC